MLPRPSVCLNSMINFLIYIFSTGMDLVNGVVRDNLKAGVLEPAMSKIKSIKAATEAAIALLRIE